MKFSDLQFHSHPNLSAAYGVQAKQFFDNGYGISVVRFKGSYGYEQGLYEGAVLKGTEEESDICYDTKIADGVIGYLTEEEVEDLLNEVGNL